VNQRAPNSTSKRGEGMPAQGRLAGKKTRQWRGAGYREAARIVVSAGGPYPGESLPYPTRTPCKGTRWREGEEPDKERYEPKRLRVREAGKTRRSGKSVGASSHRSGWFVLRGAGWRRRHLEEERGGEVRNQKEGYHAKRRVGFAKKVEVCGKHIGSS